MKGGKKDDKSTGDRDIAVTYNTPYIHKNSFIYLQRARYLHIFNKPLQQNKPAFVHYSVKYYLKGMQLRNNVIQE